MTAGPALARVLPRPLLGRLVRALYPRLEPELARIDEFVPRGGTAVDAGGWFGPWTRSLLARADRVVTIEADPTMARMLARTFPRAEVIAAAVSEFPGTAAFAATPGTRLAGTSKVTGTAPRGGTAVLEADVPGGEGQAVPCVRIDDLGLTDVGFLKLDIEGHELPALRGAAETVRRDRPVILLELEARHQPVAPVVALLESWGYLGEVLVAGEWTPLAEFDLEGHQRACVGDLDRGFLRRALRPEPRYINSVLFRSRA
ncbi:FkbM family methyltransferase [Actinocorallia herbida]|uniref:FkbM family methyltransferase n=1 Tax=Actinocorallia herbida TaxID=58109 RepID=A0A3N1D7I3_9ACTN|nr:FkbM family methyltransferase [Actinocorallia herbida]ROO89484.1 FkbM family methyltransferase [Actinocorallia herbida]